MQRSFLSNLFFLLLLNVLVKPFYILGIDAEIQSIVGTEVYGNYSVLLNITFLFNIFLDFGITNFNNRNISQHNHLLKKHLSNLLSLRMFFAVLYFIVVLLVGWLMNYSAAQFEILLVLAFNQTLAMLVMFLRSNLAGSALYVKDSIISVLDRILLIVMMGVLLWTGLGGDTFQIEWLVYGQTISYAVTALVALVMLIKETGALKLKWNLGFNLIVIKKSLPYAVLVLLMFVFHRTDSIMLERMLNDNAQQAGVYARGYRYFEAINMFSYLFAVLLLPMYSKLLKAKKAIEPLLSVSFRLLYSASFVLAIACFFYQKELMGLRYDDFLDQSSTVFGALVLGSFWISMGYIFGTLLTANGNLRILNYSSILGILLNIGLNLWLIPILQSYGSAVATLATQAGVILFQIYFTFRIMKIKPDWRVGRNTLFFSVCVGILAYLTTIFDFKWQLELMVLLVLSIALCFATGMIKKTEVIGSFFRAK